MKDSTNFTDILAKQQFVEIYMDIENGHYTLEVKFGKNYNQEPDMLTENQTIEIKDTRNMLGDVIAKDLNTETIAPPLSEPFLISDEISPIHGLSSGMNENSMAENVHEEVENVPELSNIADNVQQNTQKIQKRMMCRMADTSLILASEMDSFFTLSESDIFQKIKLMNHATRTYLAVRFFRQNVLDFEATPKSNYSLSKICSLLDVSETSIRRLKKQFQENESLKDFMKRNKFMTSIELNPRSHKYYFKRYAINYDSLDKQGLFKKQK